MTEMFRIHLVGVFVFCCIQSVFSYGGGAPAGSCDSVSPVSRHGPSTAVGASPFNLTLSKTSYSAGDTIQVTLSGPSFHGFLVVAKNTTGNFSLGNFTNLPANTKLTCNPPARGVTHKDKTSKNLVTFNWTAPSDSVDDIVFKNESLALLQMSSDSVLEETNHNFLGSLIQIAVRLNELSLTRQQSTEVRMNVLRSLGDIPKRNEAEVLQALSCLVEITDLPMGLNGAGLLIATTLLKESIHQTESIMNYTNISGNTRGLHPHILKLAIGVVSNLFSAISVQHSANIAYAVPQSILKSIIEDGQKVINKLLQLELQYHSIGEVPVLVKDGYIAINASQYSASNLQPLVVEGATFQLPPSFRNILHSRLATPGNKTDVNTSYRNNADCFQARAVSFSTNHLAVLSRNNEMIDSDLASLEIYTCYGEDTVHVHSLPKDDTIHITIPRKKNALQNESAFSYYLDKTMVNIHQINASLPQYNFEINEDDQTGFPLPYLQLHIRLDPVLHCRSFPVTVIISSQRPPYNLKNNVFKKQYDGDTQDIKIPIPKGFYKGSQNYFISLVESSLNSGRRHSNEIKGRHYTLSVWWGNCVYWNQTESRWRSSDCQVLSESSIEALHCSCTHLSTFGGYFELIPNDLTSVFVEEFFSLHENPVVIILVVLVLLLYILLLFIVTPADQRDVKKGSYVYLQDNTSTHQQKYEIIMETGLCRDAGTTARISMILHGEEGMSETRELISEDSRPMFERNSRDRFIVTLPSSLGKIFKIQLWHNNAGSSPGWFLQQVIVRDLSAGQAYYFLCHRWLAVDKEDGKVEREFTALDETNITFSLIFWCKGIQYLSDFHTWLSVWTCPAHSRFTRVQRVTVCFTLLLSYMCLNALWFQQSPPKIRGEFGLLDLSSHNIIVGAACCGIMIPLNLLLNFLFRRSKVLYIDYEEDKVVVNGKSICDFSNDGEDEPQQPALAYSILDQSILNWQNIQDWAQKQWLKRQQSVLSSPDSVKTTQTNHQVSGQPVAPVVQQTLLAEEETDQASSGFEDATSQATADRHRIKATSEISSDGQKSKNAVCHRHNPSVLDHYDDGFYGEKTMSSSLSKQLNRLPEPDEELLRGVAERSRSRYLRFAGPPQEKKLKSSRKKLIKQRRSMALIRDLWSFIFLFVLLIIIAFGKDTSAPYKLNSALKHLFASRHSANSSSFMTLRSQLSWYRWSQSVFLESLHEHVSFGSELPNTEEKLVYSIGNVQLRQMKDCQINKVGTSDADFFNETKHKNNAGITTQRNYHSYPGLWGQLDWYDNMGPVVTLNNSREEALQQLQMLESENWIDTHTQAIFVEMTLYHVATNLFSSVTLLLEVHPAGPVFTSTYIRSTHLFRYITLWDNCILGSELVMSTASTLYVVFYIYRFILVSEAVEMMRSSFYEQFVSLQFLTLWDELIRNLVGLMMFCVMIKVLQVLRYHQIFWRFQSIYRRCKNELLLAAVLYFGLIMAFSSLSTGLFGATVYSLRSLWSSMYTMSAVSVRAARWPHLQVVGVNPCLDIVLFFSFTMIHGIILTYIFVILTHRFKKTKNCRVLTMPASQLIGFYWEKLKWFGSQPEATHTDQTDSTLPPEFTMAEILYLVEELLFRMNALLGISGLPDKRSSFTDSDSDQTGADDGISSGAASEEHIVPVTTSIVLEESRLEHRVQKIEDKLCSNEPYLAQLLKLDSIGTDILSEEKEKELRSHLEFEIFRQLQLQRQELSMFNVQPNGHLACPVIQSSLPAARYSGLLNLGACSAPHDSDNSALIVRPQKIKEAHLAPSKAIPESHSAEQEFVPEELRMIQEVGLHHHQKPHLFLPPKRTQSLKVPGKQASPNDRSQKQWPEWSVHTDTSGESHLKAKLSRVSSGSLIQKHHPIKPCDKKEMIANHNSLDKKLKGNAFDKEVKKSSKDGDSTNILQEKDIRRHEPNQNSNLLTNVQNPSSGNVSPQSSESERGHKRTDSSSGQSGQERNDTSRIISKRPELPPKPTFALRTSDSVKSHSGWSPKSIQFGFTSDLITPVCHESSSGSEQEATLSSKRAPQGRRNLRKTKSRGKGKGNEGGISPPPLVLDPGFASGAEASNFDIIIHPVPSGINLDDNLMPEELL
ncbi:hypothetical protein Btru_027456 [Bulinus truncatus]|nr:hypothetical protein Btru_027456 [Bulinus truncatus]